MSSRLSAAERARFEAFLAQAFEQDARGNLDVADIQRHFWERMRQAIAGHPMSSGLIGLNQLAADIIDGKPDPILKSAVCIVPPTAMPGAGSASSEASPTVSASSTAAVVASTDSAKASTSPNTSKRPASAQPAGSKPVVKKSRAPGKAKLTKKAAASKVAATPRADVFQVRSSAPDTVRQAIEEVLRKAEAADTVPSRMAYPWVGRPLWYKPAKFRDVHRAHYRFWMSHRRAFWDWSLHAPLEPGSARLANRRKQKFRATRARLVFLSLCIETWGYYAFVEMLERQPEMFWWGGAPGKTASESRGDIFAEDLATLERHDPSRYQLTLQNALEPGAVDSFGYPNLRAFLENTEALDPTTNPENRLSQAALARVRKDLMSGVKPKETWAGPRNQEPWKSLINNHDIKVLQDGIAKELADGSYEAPTSSPITKKEKAKAEWSDYEDPESSEDESDDNADEEEESQETKLNAQGEVDVSSEDEGSGGPDVPALLLKP